MTQKQKSKKSFLPKPLLNCNNLFVTLQKQEILKGVSCSLEEGSSLVIAGESGCGKTTLAKTILGLCPYQKGEIFFESHPLEDQLKKGRKAFSKKVQMVFQDPYTSFNPRMTVEQILLEPLLLHGYKIKEAKEKILHELHSVHLSSSLLSLYPHQLSGGQKQRLSLARACSIEPKLLILDEPTSSLDTSTKLQILSLIQELRKTKNLSLLWITHELHLIPWMAEKMLVLQKGNIIEEGDSSSLLCHPQEDYTKRLVQSLPTIY